MNILFAIIVAFFVGTQVIPPTELPDLQAPAMSDFDTAVYKVCASVTASSGFGSVTEFLLPEGEACPDQFYLETYQLKPYFYDQLKNFRLKYEEAKKDE